MESVQILGCRVDALDEIAAVERIVGFARSKTPALVVTLGTEMVMRARQDANFREVLSSAKLSLCDTVGILLAARAWGFPLRKRVAGIDLLDPLCERLAREGLALALVGSKGNTAERAAAVLIARHPGLRIVLARDGYFPPSQDESIAEMVRASGASVVFAGLGSPRQELWIAEHILPRVGCVGIGVGGSFDVLAGNVVRAPDFWKNRGLEWLYRLLVEPNRWRRQLVLPHFAILAAREFAAHRLTVFRGKRHA
ncbi:MAG TPA: WecB/TagA/CpsF family glycosyltransferase [Candidatus Baltobacteraceae bacterium]|jgi:N-acetylglucosaminyldiphosphoundecaprenol N-acetyl-beta-D-mannosaminyltransferase|nr:WecB/TagA/CpsF family glycosyltransferase [Candidatus Baltobacteraceae bacterium]